MANILIQSVLKRGREEQHNTKRDPENLNAIRRATKTMGKGKTGGQAKRGPSSVFQLLERIEMNMVEERVVTLGFNKENPKKI
jgi:hypothetical protein